MIERAAAAALVSFTRLLIGARADWRTPPPVGQTLYFANHCSHLDTLAIWSALSPTTRVTTRPVAARDYWDGNGMRGYLAQNVLRAVLIERRREAQGGDPLAPAFDALAQGDSLILFPEGTRTAERLPQPFRSGLHRIAEAFPGLTLLPIYLDTLHRSMSKGAHVPLPLYCTVRFGTALERKSGESRDAFLIWDAWYGLFAIFIPVYAFLALPALAVLGGDTDDFLARTTKIQWGVMVTVYCISHAPALLILDLRDFEGQGALLLLYLMLVVQISDVMQYVFGMLFGRHKLAPTVSPSKTVEGLVGGGLAAIAIGTALWWITPFTPLQSALMSTAIVIAGAVGGLVLSAVKRSLGAKDWGSMIEGHGGMMDRMDSVSFAAPIFFHLTRYYFSG